MLGAPKAVENVPGMQASQINTLIAPEAAEKVPAGHRAHTEPPVPDENAPGRHGAQAVLLVESEYFPALHKEHAEIVAAPEVPEYVPTGQEVQADETVKPDAVEYVPIGQATQRLTDQAVEYDPAVQSEHDDTCPTLYFPGKQTEHALLYRPALYRPFPQP